MRCWTTLPEDRSCFRTAQDREFQSGGALARFEARVMWRMATCFCRRMQDVIAFLRGQKPRRGLLKKRRVCEDKI